MGIIDPVLVYLHSIIILTCNKFPPILEVLDCSYKSSFSKLSSGCRECLKSYGVKDTELSPDCWFEKVNGNRPKLRRKRFEAEWESVLRWDFVLLPERDKTWVDYSMFTLKASIKQFWCVLYVHVILTAWISWKSIFLSRSCRTK